MYDETENARRARLAELNALGMLSKEQEQEIDQFRALEAQFGKVWDTQGLRQEFEVIGFMAPFVVVKEKATGKKGSLEFIHSPRAYFNFQYD
jgi:hypothetical protein